MDWNFIICFQVSFKSFPHTELQVSRTLRFPWCRKRNLPNLWEFGKRKHRSSKDLHYNPPKFSLIWRHFFNSAKRVTLCLIDLLLVHLIQIRRSKFTKLELWNATMQTSSHELAFPVSSSHKNGPPCYRKRKNVGQELGSIDQFLTG